MAVCLVVTGGFKSSLDSLIDSLECGGLAPLWPHPRFVSAGIRPKRRQATALQRVDLNNPSYQIVSLGFGNLHINEATRHGDKVLWRVINQDAPINIGRLRLHPTLPKKFALLR